MHPECMGPKYLPLVVVPLQGERGIHLLPVNLAEQFLYPVFRAINSYFNILNIRTIRRMSKLEAIEIIGPVPFALAAIGEKQDIGHAMAERIVAVLVDKRCARNFEVD